MKCRSHSPKPAGGGQTNDDREGKRKKQPVPYNYTAATDAPRVPRGQNASSWWRRLVELYESDSRRSAELILAFHGHARWDGPIDRIDAASVTRHAAQEASPRAADAQLECAAFSKSSCILSNPRVLQFHQTFPPPLTCTGKRYFEVDDERGILFYFRTRQAHRWDEPAKHFRLSTLL